LGTGADCGCTLRFVELFLFEVQQWQLAGIEQHSFVAAVVAVAVVAVVAVVVVVAVAVVVFVVVLFL